MDVDRELALGAASVALGSAWLTVRLGRALRTFRARRRQKRALRGEHNAEKVLARAGWVVEARQVVRTIVFEVDGAPQTAQVRCDLIVRRGEHVYVAEVKTGAVAPRVEHAPTRRQLLEYGLAFEVDGVLLVDVERARVSEVRFSRVRKLDGGRVLIYFAVGAALGTLATFTLLTM